MKLLICVLFSKAKKINTSIYKCIYPVGFVLGFLYTEKQTYQIAREISDLHAPLNFSFLHV